eukprot:maker-scaffold_13-snap-gene-6.62-mRNA-1 protein AED:0.00 eAED:0.00 QI:122/1/1/1/1/1/3/345/511
MPDPVSASPEALAALEDLRDDKSPTDFVALSYPDNTSMQLEVVASGSSGVEGLKAATTEPKVYYCLLKVNFNYETVGVIKTDVSRILYIYSVPPSIPLKRKMLLGPAAGAVKNLLKPFIRNLDVDSTAELSEEMVASVVEKVTMKNKNVLDSVSNEKGMLIGGRMVAARNATGDKQSAVKYNKQYANISTSYNKAAGAEVSMDNEEDFKAAVADLRNDKHPTDWLVCSYKDKKTLSFMSAGTSPDSNPVTTLLENSATEQISYGLFRMTEDFDSLNGEKARIKQVRFGFVTVVPKDVGVITKTYVSTHKGTVTPMFRPFHVQFRVDDPSELNEEKAMQAFSAASGSKSNVTDRKAAKVEKKYERKMLGGASKEVQQLQFASDEAKTTLSDAQKELRSGGTAEGIKFLVVKFTGPKNGLVLDFAGSGSTADELAGVLEEGKDTVQYALVKYEEKVDGYDTVKFAIICVQGNSSPGIKASVGMFHGAVTEALGQAHQSIYAPSAEEVSSKFNL